MATYVVLGKMTQQGIQSAAGIPERRARAHDAASAFGIELRHTWLTMGRYDVVFVLDAPDDAAVAKFLLKVGGAGNLSTQTLRAFSDEETDEILAGL